MDKKTLEKIIIETHGQGYKFTVYTNISLDSSQVIHHAFTGYIQNKIAEQGLTPESVLVMSDEEDSKSTRYYVSIENIKFIKAVQE